MSADVAFARHSIEGDEITVRVHNTRDSVDDECFSSADTNAPTPSEVDSNYDDGHVGVLAPQSNDIGDLLQHHQERNLAYHPPHETSPAVATGSRNVFVTYRQCNRCPRWKYVVFAGIVVLSFGIPAIILYCTSRDRGAITGVESSPKEGTAKTDEGNTYLQALRVNILGIDTFRLEPDAAELVATDWMTYTDTPRVSLNDTIRLEQRYALLVLYFAMGGTGWLFKGWADDPGMHECDWDRVVCNDRDQVQELHLGIDVLLTGSLVNEIRFLSSLTLLALPRNRIQGIIPKGLYSLTNLVSLDLTNNEFAGELDSDVGKLTNLEVLKLQLNFLSGSFPDRLRTLKKLKTFDVMSNAFEGDAWDLISSWPDLETFAISMNTIDGTIPTEIGQLSRLATLDFSVTPTWGTIPTEIGLLTNLETFSADLSSIEGPLPSEIGSLGSALTNLELRGCVMDGTSIPSELGRCTSLEQLFLSLSGFIGTLPSELGMLTAVTVFDGADNFFTGTFPQELVNLDILYKFNFFGVSTLSGSLPSGMCYLGIAGGIYLDKKIQCDCCNEIEV